jgi:putative membrane protein
MPRGSAIPSVALPELATPGTWETYREKGDPMQTAAVVAVALVAALHVWFLVLEMFLWTTPYGRRVFRLDPEYARASAPLAMNQGLYNGFLAAGLVWGLAQGAAGFAVQVFFLACVVVAGVFGAATANRVILWAQAVPGAAALGLVLLARG